MRDLIQRVKAAAHGQIDRLLFEWLPAGRKAGKNWVVGNLHGDPGESLAINWTDGNFKDYSDSSVHGGDIIALYAMMHGVPPLDAAKAIAPMVGIRLGDAGGHAREKAAARTVKPADPAEQWVPMVSPPDDAPDYRPRLTDGRRGDATRHWVYYNADNKPVVVIARWDFMRDGEREKDVRPYACHKHITTGVMQWQRGSIPTPRPLFKLPQLIASASAAVIVSEGEPAADAIARMVGNDYISITSLNGAASAKSSDWSPIKDRPLVIIWPDADESQDEYDGHVIAAHKKDPNKKPRARDLSGSNYLNDVIELCRAQNVKQIMVVNRDKVAAALGYKLLPRGFDAADVPDDVKLNLVELCDKLPALEAADAEEIYITDDDEEGEGGLVKVSKHSLLIDSLVKYLKDKGITPDALDGWRYVKSWSLVCVDTTSLSNDFAFDYRHRDGKISQARIQETLEAHTRRERDKRRDSLLKTIIGQEATETGREALRQWVKAMVGSDSDLDVAVIKHWIWNIKRLALGLLTEHDLMPVIFGPQGSGKSTGVAMLVRPLAELALDVDASYLTDDRKAPALAHAIIGRWEEMQGSQRADLESLKHTITSPTIAYRPMRTNQTVVLPKTCSFIGTSNLPVDVMIQDTTGARRFVQLTTTTRCDWELLAQINPIDIWQCVSEKEPAPILDHLHLLRTHQAELVHRDPVALWLESELWDRLVWTRADNAEPYVIQKYDHLKGELFEDIAARFGNWCRTVGQSSLGIKTLALRLRQEGFISKQVRLEKSPARPRVYFLPSNLYAPPTPKDETNDWS